MAQMRFMMVQLEGGAEELSQAIKTVVQEGILAVRQLAGGSGGTAPARLQLPAGNGDVAPVREKRQYKRRPAAHAKQQAAPRNGDDQPASVHNGIGALIVEACQKAPRDQRSLLEYVRSHGHPDYTMEALSKNLYYQRRTEKVKRQDDGTWRAL
jgi:hypothetical protein